MLVPYRAEKKHLNEEYGAHCTVSNTKFSSVTLNKLAMKARERISTVISCFNKTAYKKTDINRNVVQILKTCLEYLDLNIYKFLISQNIFADLKGPKEKYKLHYGRCTGPIFRAATQHNASCSDNK